MKMKTIITLVLLVFVIGSAAYLIMGEVSSKSNSMPTGAQPPSASHSKSTSNTFGAKENKDGGSDNKIVVYYFHGNVRCSNCWNFEKYSDEIIRKAFAQELKSGRLEWRVTNVDEAPNQHFIEDYRLITRSVIVAKTQDGRQVEWKNLSRIWELVGDKPAFMNYIQTEVTAYLGKGA